MRIANYKIDRFHGTLEVTLADGRVGLLEIDLHVADEDIITSIEPLRDEREVWERFVVRAPYATKYSIQIPEPLQPLREAEPKPIFTLKLPADESGVTIKVVQ